MGVAVLGLIADQEFGLLFYAPAWVLVAAGIPALWRRQREATLGLLGLVGGYVFVLMRYRWMQWDAGWTPPPRFILAVVPLLLPFLAEGLDRLRGRGLALVHTLWLVWSVSVAWCLALVPFWRYNTLSGRSTLLRLLGAELGLDLARFLPSLRAPTRLDLDPAGGRGSDPRRGHRSGSAPSVVAGHRLGGGRPAAAPAPRDRAR